MRKVTTINLNGNAYQMDEEGYEALRRYLEDAGRSLEGNPDRAEIMADLEQAIAEKCRLVLGPYKTVVSAAEIGRIVQEMGPVAGGSAGDSTAEPGGASASGAAPRPRRLYRISEGQKIAGVCNGLAVFAGVEVAWVRVAFVLLAIFTGGFWLAVYCVLIFVLPVACSPEELAAARGQPFNAQELVDRVRKKHADFRAERRAQREWGRHAQWYPHGVTAGVPPQPPGPAARVAGGVMLPVFTVLSAGWFALMAVAAVMVWHTYMPPGYWPPAHGYLAHLPRWMALLAVVAIYALLALPIGAGRRTALYYANGGHQHGWADAWSGLLWIALVAVALVAAWAWLPQLQDVLHQLLGPRRGAGWI
ncbi:MAG TPA: PspC domain-containing protein [Steroidobacteraceae bacterium]|nr:PspC domain-containing protein [Steroidobacteraceae bacterium]